MLPEISEIKAKRKLLGLSQTGLSEKTGISQSLIAKVEAGKIIPSYANAKKLFDFFESVKEKTGFLAKEIMTQKVVVAGKETAIKEAIRLMKNNGISQLPVVEAGLVIGTVSERLIVDRIKDEKDLPQFMEKKVVDLMEDAMPQISEEMPASAISALLEHNQSALVTKKGKITGIISRSDLLGALLKPKKGQA